MFHPSNLDSGSGATLDPQFRPAASQDRLQHHSRMGEGGLLSERELRLLLDRYCVQCWGDVRVLWQDPGQALPHQQRGGL